MEIKKLIKNSLKVGLSIMLGGLILYWMYRDFDFKTVANTLMHGMNWTWMLLSFPFGILAQMFRGWRWHLTLEPIGEKPRTSVSINSIFLSYAVSLIVPRIGEFARCGILRRYDGVSFPKALGTVVMERAIDSALVMLIALCTFILQLHIFNTFFDETGTNISTILAGFSTMGYVVTAVCGIAVCILGWYIMRSFAIYNKVRDMVRGIWQGIMSIRTVKHPWLFIAFTLGIWASYFLHYYLTFFCFEATAHLGMACALVTFIVGSIAVIVPTPNGAGPWHFAVKTMLILYGISDVDALNFVLIVHSVQTLLVIVLGIYAWTALSFTKKRIQNL